MHKKIKSLSSKIKSSKSLRQKIISSLLVAAVVFFCSYLLYINRFVSTDDAYVNANVVEIAPQVSGLILQLNINNNQFVEQNQSLFIIDPAQFKINLDKAKAALDAANAKLFLATKTAARTKILTAKKVLPTQSYDDAEANLQNATADQKLALANLAQAKLDLEHTNVIAPVSGRITNMSLRQGNIVTANQPLFALVDDNEFWVDANFKETEIKNIYSGQKAKIIIDMYPHHVFRGVVESISAGSGSVFSLLPPENATGNWIKITQRVPIKIRIINVDSKYPLRIGTTANVTIDTKHFFH